jgi:hypothetical protein
VFWFLYNASLPRHLVLKTPTWFFQIPVFTIPIFKNTSFRLANSIGTLLGFFFETPLARSAVQRVSLKIRHVRRL